MKKSASKWSVVFSNGASELWLFHFLTQKNGKLRDKKIALERTEDFFIYILLFLPFPVITFHAMVPLKEPGQKQ